MADSGLRAARSVLKIPKPFHCRGRRLPGRMALWLVSRSKRHLDAHWPIRWLRCPSECVGHACHRACRAMLEVAKITGRDDATESRKATPSAPCAWTFRRFSWPISDALISEERPQEEAAEIFFHYSCRIYIHSRRDGLPFTHDLWETSMRSTAEVRSTVLLSALALILSAPAQGVVVKVDLYRKNSDLDKSKARAARNVLCESHLPSCQMYGAKELEMAHRPCSRSYIL